MSHFNGISNVWVEHMNQYNAYKSYFSLTVYKDFDRASDDKVIRIVSKWWSKGEEMIKSNKRPSCYLIHSLSSFFFRCPVFAF